MTNGEPSPEAKRNGIYIIAAAIVLAALLQLVVFEQYTEIRLGILGVEVALFVVLIWAYAGGIGRAVAWQENRKLRHHIRMHPEMVSYLEGLISQVEDTLGPRTDRFRTASLSILNAWWQVWSTTLNTDKPPAFTESERQRYDDAQRAAAFWQTHLADWPVLRNIAAHLLQKLARQDGLAYLDAATLVRSYIATSTAYIRDFTLSAQQMNLAKISQVTLGEWATFAKRVNALIAEAAKIDSEGPSKVGYGLDLKFEPVVENLAILTVLPAMAPGKDSFSTWAAAVAGPSTKQDPPPPKDPSKT